MRSGSLLFFHGRRSFFRKESGMKTDKKKDCTVSEKDLETIVKFIESVKFGSISIIIQDGRIVQIEKNEKVRV